ncbi:hypothetical protein HMPREF1982_04101 [Clostridiales bacterium oral taxon 876 str. F0540]|nr:hypothetical protein HMPREF1982_04101 [Clostridiales bacterium oral taxon 876 str. F0540]
MSKFLKIVIALILILILEVVFIYFGYSKNNNADKKSFINYDNNIIILSHP